MSTTTATTTTEITQAPPPFTVLSRVASIPLVSSSLETIDHQLSSNAYTRSLYPAAKGISSTAYKYTEPIQTRLAPLIVRADGYANKAVDVVEARYPYPFTVKPEEVTEYVRERRQSATERIHHSIDETVKNPALNVATGIDHSFAPIIDLVEGAVKRITNSNEPGPSGPDTKYQYQRVLALTKNLYGYSGEQLKQLQAQFALLQGVSDLAHSISSHANSSLANAQSVIHQLSGTMLAELQKLQENTTALATSIQSSATSTVQSRVSPDTQLAFVELSRTLSATISDFSSTLTAKDIPLPEKMTKIVANVRDHIVPVLGSVTKVITVALTPKLEVATPQVDGVPSLPKDVPLEPKHAVHVKDEGPASDGAVLSEEKHHETKIKHLEQNGKHPEPDVKNRESNAKHSDKHPEPDVKHRESNTKHSDKHRESHTKHSDSTKVSSPVKERHHRSAAPSKDKQSTFSEKSEVVSSKRGTRDHTAHTR